MAARTPQGTGRLVRVRLDVVELEKRQAAAARERALDWRHNLDPARDLRVGEPVAPPLRERWAALDRAIALERAAMFPTDRKHWVAEEAVQEYAPEALADAGAPLGAEFPDRFAEHLRFYPDEDELAGEDEYDEEPADHVFSI